MATRRPHPSSPQPSDGAEEVMLLTWPCLRLQGAGAKRLVGLDISVSPNAKKTEVVGWHDGALRIRLCAPPVDGAANEALRRWLSDQIGTPMNTIELQRGATGRRKQLTLNCEPARVVQWLQTLRDQGTLTSP